jgi:hypothetical protein
VALRGKNLMKTPLEIHFFLKYIFLPKKIDFKKKPSTTPKSREKKQTPKIQVVEKVKFNNGKNKKS